MRISLANSPTAIHRRNSHGNVKRKEVNLRTRTLFATISTENTAGDKNHRAREKHDFPLTPAKGEKKESIDDCFDFAFAALTASAFALFSAILAFCSAVRLGMLFLEMELKLEC